MGRGWGGDCVFGVIGGHRVKPGGEGKIVPHHGQRESTPELETKIRQSKVIVRSKQQKKKQCSRGLLLEKEEGCCNLQPSRVFTPRLSTALWLRAAQQFFSPEEQPFSGTNSTQAFLWSSKNGSVCTKQVCNIQLFG